MTIAIIISIIGMTSEGVTPAINREEVEVALKGMKNRKAMGRGWIPVEVWKSLGEQRVDNVVGSAPEDFRAGENARGMEARCDRTNH